MTNSCCTCIPVRLRTADAKPLTQIIWLNEEMAKLDQFSIPSEHNGTRFNAILDIVKRETVLIGHRLVHEISIAPHDPTPKTLIGQLKAKWDAGLPNRQAGRPLWRFAGAALATLIAALIWFVLKDAILLLFVEPIASLVWVFVTLGGLMPLVALVLGFYFTCQFFDRKQPFFVGFVLVMSGFGLFLTAQFTEALSDHIAVGAKFPDVYDSTGREILRGLATETIGFQDRISPIWEPIVVVLNGAGLAGVVAFANSFFGWARGRKDADELMGDNSTLLGRRLSNVPEDGAEKPENPVPILELPLKPLTVEFDDIPPLPDHC